MHVTYREAAAARSDSCARSRSRESDVDAAATDLLCSTARREAIKDRVQLRGLGHRGATTTATVRDAAHGWREVEHRRQAATLASCSSWGDASAINGSLGVLQRVDLSSGSRTGPGSDGLLVVGRARVVGGVRRRRALIGGRSGRTSATRTKMRRGRPSV